MQNNISNKIKMIRDKYMLSQERFGNKIGISGKTVSAYERGTVTPTYKVLERIAEVYDTNILTASKSKEEQLNNKIRKLEVLIDEIKLMLNLKNEY